MLENSGVLTTQSILLYDIVSLIIEIHGYYFQNVLRTMKEL